MSNALTFLGRDMAVDLGTANTLVYVRGRGIVLNEPSVVALNTNNGQILAARAQATRMIGRPPAAGGGASGGHGPSPADPSGGRGTGRGHSPRGKEGLPPHPRGAPRRGTKEGPRLGVPARRRAARRDPGPGPGQRSAQDCRHL